jgi:hypothetical protein
VKPRPSALLLILANTVPLFGVVLFGWRVIDILILYWTESVVIGVINVMRMAKCPADNLLAGPIPGQSGRQMPAEVRTKLLARMPTGAMTALKFFMIPFFALHYGAFCYGHLMAVTGFFGASARGNGLVNSLEYFWQVDYWIAVMAIVASHMYSYFANFVRGGEYRNTNLFLLMQRPYGRIVIMHIAIIIGAGFVAWLDSPLPILMILILGKICIDVRLHEKERVKLATTATLPDELPTTR